MTLSRDIEESRGSNSGDPAFASDADPLATLGVDKKGHPRGLFLYDGGWGVWKFLVGFIAYRDTLDHFRFAPIQTRLARDLCREHGKPFDVSTAILFGGDATIYTHSDSILRLLYPHLGWMYALVGFLLLLVPRFVRDVGYRLFARYRGKIWIGVKKVACMGDTAMHPYRNAVVGLEDEDLPLPESWGFSSNDGGGNDDNNNDNNDTS